MILEPGAELDDSIGGRLQGVVTRSMAASQLVDCLYRVAAGERYVRRAVVKTMDSHDHLGVKAAQRLTAREMQIVALICEGLKNKQIARSWGPRNR